MIAFQKTGLLAFLSTIKFFTLYIVFVLLVELF